MKSQPIKILDSGAEMNGDKTHRYSLWRTWNYDLPRIMFIGLNPSRADAQYNDPTITRCINFAAGWGYGSLYFANIFSFRTPYVNAQKIKPGAEDWWPPLIENIRNAATDVTDDFLELMMQRSDRIVCCWGSWKIPDFNGRAGTVLWMIKKTGKEPYCFGTNADGQPKHPLYLKSSAQIYKFGQAK